MVAHDPSTTPTPDGLDPDGTDAGPPNALDRWYAVLIRLVAPNGRPVRKTLLLAPVLILLVDVPLGLLSAALSLAPSREAPPVTGQLVAVLVVVAPVLETWLVIGLHRGASALARLASRDTRRADAARLLGALAAGAVMAALHAPYSLHRLTSAGVFFAVQGLQYEAWRREYHFVFAYLALAGTHCINNAILAGLLLLAQSLG